MTLNAPRIEYIINVPIYPIFCLNTNIIVRPTYIIIKNIDMNIINFVSFYYYIYNISYEFSINSKDIIT